MLTVIDILYTKLYKKILHLKLKILIYKNLRRKLNN